jgi:hypothetical protein
VHFNAEPGASKPCGKKLPVACGKLEVHSLKGGAMIRRSARIVWCAVVLVGRVDDVAVVTCHSDIAVRDAPRRTHSRIFSCLPTLYLGVFSIQGS